MAHRALMPSQIPGATCEGREPVKVMSRRLTYHNTGASEHLAETSSGVVREGALEVVLGVEARVVVNIAAGRIYVDGGRGCRDNRSVGGGDLLGLDRLGLLNLTSEFETRHFAEGR